MRAASAIEAFSLARTLGDLHRYRQTEENSSFTIHDVCSSPLVSGPVPAALRSRSELSALARDRSNGCRSIVRLFWTMLRGGECRKRGTGAADDTQGSAAAHRHAERCLPRRNTGGKDPSVQR